MILFSIKVSSQTLFANVKGDLKACKIRVIVLHRCDTDAWSFQFWWCLLKADLHIALGCATKTVRNYFYNWSMKNSNWLLIKNKVLEKMFLQNMKEIKIQNIHWKVAHPNRLL